MSSPDLLQYIRFALRALRRTPTVTATAVLTLGVGIGMASAMFTVFHAVVVRRLPVQDQDRIVELSGVAKGAARARSVPSLSPREPYPSERRRLCTLGLRFCCGDGRRPTASSQAGDRHR